MYSIIIPARNERGNILPGLERLAKLFGREAEVVFAEGGSTDGTWEEIERVMASKEWPFGVQALRQPGRGKGDAVRAGFAAAQGDVLAILDADLTTPPESLPEFFAALAEAKGDLINGNRFGRPMAPGAMRFLNRLGNRFFAWLLSRSLGIHIGDALCGTKVLSRANYEKIAAWRKDFGDFDPFGDFDLVFGAAALGLKIHDVPVAYEARVYGTTNIRRFRDGWRLLKMVWRGRSVRRKP